MLRNSIEGVGGSERVEGGRLVEWRRTVHRTPEPMWTEFCTTAFVAHTLLELGLPLDHIILGDDLYDKEMITLRKSVPIPSVLEDLFESARAQNFGLGCSASSSLLSGLAGMKGGRTGLIARLYAPVCAAKSTHRPHLGLRVDIDALPVEECVDENVHAPAREGFASNTNGRMHACGHDGHTAIGLGLAARLLQEPIQADVWLLFQPAEEGGDGGSVFAYRLPQLVKLDVLLALHLGLISQPRKIVCGANFLSSQILKVEFFGGSAHAAACPHVGRNAVLAAAQAIVALYGLSRHGDGETRVNVGRLHADNAHNVVGAHAEFELELRGETDEIVDYLVNRANAVVTGAATMCDVSVSVSPGLRMVTCRSSQPLKRALRNAALRLGVPEGAIIDEIPVRGCEDAPRIMQRVVNDGGQAMYLALSCDTHGGHHTETFDIDEDLLLWGVRLVHAVLCDSLTG